MQQAYRDQVSSDEWHGFLCPWAKKTPSLLKFITMNPAPRTTKEEWEEWPKKWIVRADLAREIETELTELKSEFCKMVLEAAKIADRNVELRFRAEKAEAQLHALTLICGTNDVNKFQSWVDKERERAEKAEADCVKLNRLLLMSRDDRENDLMSEIEEQARLLGLSANQNAMLLTKVNNLSALWSQFIDIMDIVEESDGGNEFRPNRILSCRALDAQKMSDIIEKAKLVVNAGVKSEH